MGTPELEGLRTLMEDSPGLVFAADARGAITYLNAAARAYWGAELGRRAEVIVGAPLAERFQWGEYGPAGVRAWFAATVTPLADGCWCLSTDITEMKRDEERLRRSEQLLVDTQGTAHLGTWEWDITQSHATWSAELYRIYGLEPQTYTPSYEAYLAKVHPDDRQRVIDATNRVFHEHVPYSHDERVFRPDGSIRQLHTWTHPVLDNEGKLVRLVGVCQDVTDRALAEEAVRELAVGLEARVAERTRTIERSLRDLEQFNSMVSHDLRAPLAVIQLSTDLILREKVLSDRTRENIGRVQRSVEHMNQLLVDLLGLARVGQAEVRHVELDLSRMCKQIVDELRTGGPREADVRIADGIVCDADEGLMRIAMTNLLSNAWKFTAARPRTMIEVTVDERGILRIRDNGAGFDMKDVSRLFSAFQRLHRTEAFPGTGVGLATVHRIVERHGGRIWAESAPDAGATFFVDLRTLRVHS